MIFNIGLKMFSILLFIVVSFYRIFDNGYDHCDECNKYRKITINDNHEYLCYECNYKK